MSKLKDLTGQTFERLTVVSRAENSKDGQARWNCKCVCGNTTIVSGVYLRRGKIKSCGCYMREVIADIGRQSKIHGESKTRLYRVWRGIKQRVNDPNRAKYKYYGGRGITICPEWDHSYETFRDWALSHGYDPNAKFGECTIDRIDMNGNYEPSNCRWVSIAENNRNRRSKTQVKLDNLKMQGGKKNDD